jgi:hypothetical protein
MTFFDVNFPSKSNKQKNLGEKSFFIGVLKVNDENSRIRIRIHESEAKCHGSATLMSTVQLAKFAVIENEA